MLKAYEGIDYQSLIKPDRVHGSLYYDPKIYAEELEKIWYREWVFVGHESEVPKPGDWRTGHIGEQPIILTRDRQNNIRIYMNRCRHRANIVCAERKGHATAFICPYHGWTYSVDGTLQGGPFLEDYGPEFKKSDYGLNEVPRVASYRGFVFASLSLVGKSLTEHLAHAKDHIDRFCDMSPTGRIMMNAGVYRIRLRANWKMWMENSVDAYHVLQTHASNFYLENLLNPAKKPQGGKPPFLLIRERDLGNGHSDLDMRPQRRITGMTYTAEWDSDLSERAQKEYVDAMARFHGKEKAETLLRDGPPHCVVFPNLFFMFQEIRWCVPVGVGETYLYYAPCLLEGAPEEINTARLRRDEGAYGPAGFQLADDIEVWERNFAGLQAKLDEWVLMNRGYNKSVALDAEGIPGQDQMSEITMRAQWQHYLTIMEA